MRKKIEVDSCFCDVCKKGAASYNACVACGKDYCYECAKTNTVTYHAYVGASGSGDANYCIGCDLKATDEKHAAYVQIHRLRREGTAFWEDFKKRTDAAEEKLKSLL